MVALIGLSGCANDRLFGRLVAFQPPWRQRKSEIPIFSMSSAQTSLAYMLRTEAQRTMTKAVTEPPIQSMDARSREIFRLVVENYLAEGDPLGSRNLARRLPQQLSPATIRNVMSDLEHLGLIYSPHISAGRLPTQQGLRFFVDAFMEIGDLSEKERQIIEAQVVSAGRSQSLEHMLIEASQMLSGLSRGAGVVLAAKTDAPLKHIEFIQLEPRKALAILVTQNGDVENRILDLPAGVTISQLVEASNYLNSHIRGLTLAEARAEMERLRAEARSALDTLSQS